MEFIKKVPAQESAIAQPKPKFFRRFAKKAAPIALASWIAFSPLFGGCEVKEKVNGAWQEYSLEYSQLEKLRDEKKELLAKIEVVKERGGLDSLLAKKMGAKKQIDSMQAETAKIDSLAALVEGKMNKTSSDIFEWCVGIPASLIVLLIFLAKKPDGAMTKIVGGTLLGVIMGGLWGLLAGEVLNYAVFYGFLGCLWGNVKALTDSNE